MKRIKGIITGLLMIISIVGMSVPVLAANESFSFYLPNTDTTYSVCTSHSNNKSYANDSATVKTTSNNAPGWGMAFCMKHRYIGSDGLPHYQTDTVTSPAFWISGLGTVHPTYLSGHNITGRDYYVAARIDNDYTGYYSSAGKFNSDYTNP